MRAFALAVLVASAGCATRQPESVADLLKRADMPPERVACLLATEANYRLRKQACGKSRSTTCATDWLIDKQHEEIDECFSKY